MKTIKKEMIDVSSVEVRELTFEEFKNLVIQSTDNATPIAQILLHMIWVTTGLEKVQIDQQLTFEDYTKLLTKITEANKRWFDNRPPFMRNPTTSSA